MIKQLEEGKAYEFTRDANMGVGRRFQEGDVVVARETSKRGEGGAVAFWRDGRVRVQVLSTVALMVMNESTQPVDTDLLELEDGQTLDHKRTA